MRAAMFSPMPPSRSGIADYAAALAGPLSRLVELEVFSDAQQLFRPERFDAILYHVGNNPHHAFVYEAALRHPGVVVMHEANLHHLLADLTIQRGDWAGYVEECAYNGSAAARAFAERVRRLEKAPDYDGLPMTRRLLETARGLVVHSSYMQEQMRAQGFCGPVARIPHGAWIPEVDRNAWRWRLGLDELTPLVGIFGFLKPYKRIAEALRAFRRLVRMEPRARMILAGEPHPDLPVYPLIQSLDLTAQVRVLGFSPPDDFTGYIGACDIVLNLRYPTVGESSGSMLRAMGLGKAVLVSDTGAFREFPDDVCLKVPVGAGEEDVLYEYLNLLVSRPDVAAALGARARAYVCRECRWEAVAERYARVLGGDWEGEERPDAETRRHGDAATVTPDYVAGWAADERARQYVDTHKDRLTRTLEIVPPGGPEDRILEMGAYLQITPALKTRLGYGEVRGCYYGPPGRVDRKVVESEGGERFECLIDHFDAERDCFPYPDAHFATVLCCELIEHLGADPMHMMAQINRVLRPGGHLVLTTPNIAGLRAVSAVLQGYHPGFFHAYIQPRAAGEMEARHNREYAPREVQLLLENSGFEVTLLETGPFREEPHPEYGWVVHLLERYRLANDLRGDGIYAVGRKTGPVRERYPGWLYV